MGSTAPLCTHAASYKHEGSTRHNAHLRGARSSPAGRCSRSSRKLPRCSSEGREGAQAGRGEGSAQRGRCPLKCKEGCSRTAAAAHSSQSVARSHACTCKAAAAACSHLAVVAEAAGRSRAVGLPALPPPAARGRLPPRRPLPARWVDAQGVGAELRGQQKKGGGFIAGRCTSRAFMDYRRAFMDYLLVPPAAKVPSLQHTWPRPARQLPGHTWPWRRAQAAASAAEQGQEHRRGAGEMRFSGVRFVGLGQCSTCSRPAHLPPLAHQPGHPSHENELGALVNALPSHQTHT